MEKKSTPTISTTEGSAAAAGRESRRPLLRLLRSPAFPLVPQLVALAVLAALIGAGWGRHGIANVAVEGPLIYTNLATLGFWTLWLMGLILALPLAGRLWCTVCPVGACNDLAARVGAGRLYPRRLQNFLPMAALFFLSVAGSEIYRVNRYPDRTALMLLGVLAASVAAGLLFRGRVFCRWWCPVGGMIGLVGRIAPVEVKSRDQAVCRRCESKACFLGGSRWYRLSWTGWHSLFRLRRPGCPAFVFPPEAAANANCLLCMQCFKNCPYDNLRLGARRPGSGLWRETTRDRSEFLVLVVLCGVVLYRLARFWGGLRVFLEWPAATLALTFPSLPPAGAQAVNYLFVFLLWPGIFLLALGTAARLAGEFSLVSWPAEGDKSAAALYDLAEIDEERRRSEQGWGSRRHTLGGYLAVFGRLFIPLTAGLFAAFALVKFNEKAGYLPLALADPAGVRSWFAINDLDLVAAPESLVPLLWARWAAACLAAAGLLFSLWSAPRVAGAAYGEGSPAAARGTAVFRLGLLAAGGLLLNCLRVWLFRAF